MIFSYRSPFNIKSKKIAQPALTSPFKPCLHLLPLHLQRRNAWARVFRTCSSLMICHLWRSWRCSPASPASSRTPVTCRRPCWTTSECARVTPSSAISCSGTASLLPLTHASSVLHEHSSELLCPYPDWNRPRRMSPKTH